MLHNIIVYFGVCRNSLNDWNVGLHNVVLLYECDDGQSLWLHVLNVNAI